LQRLQECPFVLKAYQYNQGINVRIIQDSADTTSVKTQKADIMITELCRADLFDLLSEKGAIKDRQLFKAVTK
jgi:hypothetical protein